MAYALITGASKGIGKAIANELARHGYNLLLVARSTNLLKDTAQTLSEKYKIVVDTCVLDLSENEAPAKIKNWCVDNHYDVSVLVNNAGYGLWGNFEELPLQDQLDMMTVNMNTVVRLTYEMLPMLRKNAQSFILNISSTAAYQAVPTLSVYAASKSFVLLFTRALRQELLKSNVSVSCLSPGATRTEFMDRAGMQSLKATAAKFEMTPEAVAEIGIAGLFSKKSEIIPGFTNYFSAKLAALVPKSLTEKIAARIYKTN